LNRLDGRVIIEWGCEREPHVGVGGLPGSDLFSRRSGGAPTTGIFDALVVYDKRPVAGDRPRGSASV